MNILAQTFIELANNNKNYIGNLWGLNHYSIIDNEVENFINRIDSVLNI
ncbi:hypothetical protein [Mycoplasmopsis caviae]|nr:hypothetical protein [Mycoplasmopsis caviae]